MNQAVEAFLNEVWREVMTIYAKESAQIGELEHRSSLQAGIMDYLQVAWRKGKFISISMSRSPGAIVHIKSKRVLTLRN